MIGQSNYNVRNALTYCDNAFVHDQHDRFELLINNLEREQNALLYGSDVHKVRPLLKVSKGHFHLFMEDGCVSTPLYTMDSCKNTFFDGLVGKGLQGAYKQYVQIANRLIDERYDANADMTTCQPQDVNSGTPTVVERLAERFLAAGFNRAATLTVENINSFLDSFKLINILVTVASIFALVLFFFVVYQPMIRRMDTEIKNVRYLLLLFPDEVSRVVPAIIAAGRELLKDGHVSGASSVASGSSGAMATSKGVKSHAGAATPAADKPAKA
jgi:hypothetical protein